MMDEEPASFTPLKDVGGLNQNGGKIVLVCAGDILKTGDPRDIASHVENDAADGDHHLFS